MSLNILGGILFFHVCQSVSSPYFVLIVQRMVAFQCRTFFIWQQKVFYCTRTLSSHHWPSRAGFIFIFYHDVWGLNDAWQRAYINTFLSCIEFAIIIILSCQAQKHSFMISRTRIITLQIVQLTRGMQTMWQAKVGERPYNSSLGH